MKKILLVDDEESLRHLIGIRLKEAEYAVIEAGDGKEALELVKTEKPDLIVTDVLMPNLTGYEFFQALKDLERSGPKTPVIVMSSRHNMKDFFVSWEIEGFVAKPFDAKVLLEKIDYILGTKREVAKPAKVEAPKPEAPAPAPKAPAAPEAPKPKAPTTGGAKKVLLAIVEDPLFKKTEDCVKKQGFSVVRAVDTQDAVKTYQDEKPDFIFCEFKDSVDVMNVPTVSKETAKIALGKTVPFYVLCPAHFDLDAGKLFKKAQIVTFATEDDIIKKLPALLVASEQK